MASLGDFDALVSSDAKFASAWREINGQLQAEGLDVTGAKIALTESFEQLVSQGFGLQEDEAIRAAKEYVKTGQTVLGAVSTVKGLIDAATSNASPLQVTQAFTGTMIGLGVAAGAVSAGVGAAIVAAVGTLLTILQQSGLFGAQPGGVEICAGVRTPSQPNFVIGCIGMWGSAVAPGSVNWRTFPNQSDPADAAWFAACPNSGCNEFSWKGAQFGNSLTSNPAGSMRPIDYAFDQYAAIEYLATHETGPAFFTPGFINAWRSNAEYALNGLKPQTDARVLLHFLRLWNRAHGAPSIPFASWAPGTFFGPLVSLALNDLQPGDPLVSGQDLIARAGQIKSPPSVSPPTGLSGKSTSTKIATVAVAAPIALTLGTIAYAWIMGKSVDAVLSRLWAGTKSFVRHVAGERASNPLDLFERQSTTVQSLLFPRSRFDARSARSWARKHGYRATKAHATGDYVRVRQHPPGDFVRSSFRTIPFGHSGIKAVIGHLR